MRLGLLSRRGRRGLSPAMGREMRDSVMARAPVRAFWITHHPPDDDIQERLGCGHPPGLAVIDVVLHREK